MRVVIFLHFFGVAVGDQQNIVRLKRHIRRFAVQESLSGI